MKTSTCSNVSYRRGWKMCDINGNFNSDVKLIQEHGCFSSNINLWSRALFGKCAQHNCAEGNKCVLKEDDFKCELAYCVGNPIVRNALLNEQFGLSRDLGHGMMYKCMKGMKMSGKPFAVCRETGKWKSMFICDISCEKGWIEFGGHCYNIGPDKKTWEESKADCQRKGSYLVKIEDASENIWLQNVMIANNIDRMRIGAHDNVQEGTWRWIKDNSIVDFKDWGDQQPNNVNGNQNCVELLRSLSYRWNDHDCTSLLLYICEK